MKIYTAITKNIEINEYCGNFNKNGIITKGNNHIIVKNGATKAFASFGLI